MLKTYGADETGQRLIEIDDGALDAALWIDLCTPSADEVTALQSLGLAVPSDEDLRSIELSRRIYRAGEAEYMTVALHKDIHDPAKASMSPVCFILTSTAVVTVRYAESAVMDTAPELLGGPDPKHVFLSLLEASVGSLADQLEDLGRKMRTESRIVRVDDQPQAADLRRALVFFGHAADEIGLIRMSLTTLERVVNHFEQIEAEADDTGTLTPAVRRLERDVSAILVFADFLAARASSVADATLGLIDLDQNQSVSMLSAIVSLFAPATLIASIYGMNFDRMPELHDQFGFVIALGSMALSAFITLLFFKWRGWL